MSDRRETERRLEAFTIPPPGELVRIRALTAGRAAALATVSPDRWDRIWSSRLFRLAWALAVVLLAAGHLMVPRGPSARATAPRYVERVLGTEASDELVAGLLLPPVDQSVLPAWDGSGRSDQTDGEIRNE